MLKMIALVLLCSLLTTVTDNKIISDDEKFDGGLGDYLEKVVITFSKSHSVILIDSNYLVLKNTVNIKLNSTNVDAIKKFANGRITYVINYHNLIQLNGTLHHLHFNDDSTCVVIVNETIPDLAGIGKLLWKFKLYASIVANRRRDGISLHTLDLKGSKCGTRFRLKKVDRLVRYDMKRCFHGCPFRVIWSVFPPWVIEVSNRTKEGAHVEMMRLFQQTSGFKITFMPENLNYLRELSVDYKFDSISKDFDRDYADLYIGLSSYFGDPPFAKTFTIDNKLYFIMRRPDRLAYWRMFIGVFDWIGWITICLTLIVVAIALTYLARKMEDVHFVQMGKNLVHCISIALGMGIYMSPNRLSSRVLIISYLFASITLTSLTQGKLYSFLSKPLYNQRIGDLRQLLSSGIPIESPGGMRVLFLGKDDVNDRLLKNMIDVNYGSFVEHALSAYRKNTARIIDEGVKILRPNLWDAMGKFEIHSFLMCYYMPEKHVLYGYFDRTVHRIIETGFMDMIVNHMRFQYSLKEEMRENGAVFSITLEHMEAGFYLLVIGYGAASIVLLFEIVAERYL